MSKAIQGAVLLGGALAGFVVMDIATGGLGAAFNSVLAVKLIEGLAIAGVSMEAGAVANALTSNRGMNVTTRQPSSLRQIIYGTQRVGGVMVYRSTTGGSHRQMNYVIVLAGHEVSSINGIYLDGRQVHFNNGIGTTTRNGVTFGGSADGNTYTGPNGVDYNFGGLVYCEACYGDQTNQPNTTPGGGFNTGLQANDPAWGPSAEGIPYFGGCAYVYLKIEADSNTFPGEPEIRFDINGKCDIYDPRTNTRGYTSNWALICADIITDPVYGIGDAVNQAQLIAAANVCDEQVPLAAGGTESRYAAHWHYDAGTAAGDALSTLMGAAGGRVSRVGGEWYITPAYFQGATAAFGEDVFTADVEWTPNRSFKELCNRVTGTYTAPNYPYNVLGNYYDGSNGSQDNFGFAFQPTNYPQYACDALHGYPVDQYLTEDGGVILTKEISQQCVLSIAQAQRLAKIALLRNRQQGSGTFHMALPAYQLQPCDTFLQTFDRQGWTDKLLEVVGVGWHCETGSSGNAPGITVQLQVQETSATVYEWSPAEELGIYDVPAMTAQAPYTPAAPMNVKLISSAATALVALDGTVTPRIEVTWDTPLDYLTKQIQVQYQLTGALTWTDAGSVDVSLNSCYISPVIAGQQYDVRIRSFRANGATSPWTEVDGFTAGVVLSVQTQDGFGTGSLNAYAFNDGTAEILCNGFTALIGSYSVPILTGGYALTGLNQRQLYYIYYNDPTGAGGAVTPIATQNPDDFRGKLGYFLIDSIVTPYAATVTGGSGGGASGATNRYVPSAFSDVGSSTTTTPSAAYDGDVTSDARVSGTYRETANHATGADPTTVRFSTGDCIWSGFPSIVLTAGATINVTASVTSTGVPCTITSMGNTLLDTSSTTAEATYTATIPSGTNLSTVTVEAVCDGSSIATVGSPVSYTGSIQGFEIWIQA